MAQTSKATTPSLPELVGDDIRDRLGPRTEGSLWLAFVDRRGKLALCTPIAEGTGTVDDLLLRDLAELIRRFDMPGAVLVVHRTSGGGSRADRRLWRALRQRLDATGATRLDLLVIPATG